MVSPCFLIAGNGIDAFQPSIWAQEVINAEILQIDQKLIIACPACDTKGSAVAHVVSVASWTVIRSTHWPIVCIECASCGSDLLCRVEGSTRSSSE